MRWSDRSAPPSPRPSRGPQIDVRITRNIATCAIGWKNDMAPVDLARAALADIGIDPIEAVIRGGTDGSRLTEMGVPCPNLFTGMQKHPRPARIRLGAGHGLATRLMLQIAERANAAESRG